MAKVASKKKVEPTENNLVTALQFVAVAQEKDQLNYQTHCGIFYNRVIATDGFITACHPILIDESLQCAPKTFNLLKALKMLKSTYDLTLNHDSLTVTSGKTRIKVPSLTLASIPQITPDALLCNLPPSVVAALFTVAPLADESAARVMLGSILLRDFSAAATDGQAILEAWHGEQLPVGAHGVAIPKAAIKALASTKQTPTGFGMSRNSITFYFANGAWLKFQLYVDGWADINKVLNVPTNHKAPPSGFLDAIKTAFNFSENKKIYIIGNTVKSSNLPNDGAYIEIENIGCNVVFPGESFLRILPHIKTMDILSEQCKLMFFGEGVRGAIVGGYT